MQTMDLPQNQSFLINTPTYCIPTRASRVRASAHSPGTGSNFAFLCVSSCRMYAHDDTDSPLAAASSPAGSLQDQALGRKGVAGAAAGSPTAPTTQLPLVLGSAEEGDASVSSPRSLWALWCSMAIIWVLLCASVALAWWLLASKRRSTTAVRELSPHGRRTVIPVSLRNGGPKPG
jgi:hypothetical protein